MNNKVFNRAPLAFILLLVTAPINAESLSLATKPLYTGSTEAPMMMLVMGRDHTLYYEAYNDASDLDGDGVIDIQFMPDYDYEGYFNVDACYSYNTWNTFVPIVLATGDDRVCETNSEHWSGNFLNYQTMTRMDVLKKVLYGGTRSYDISGNTKLQRTYIPQDAHSWAKSYESETVNGYDIRDYTPYELPNNNTAHFFGSVTYTSDTSSPILRVRENVNISGDDAGVWDWASTERPVLNDSGDDYEVTVRVCKSSALLESNCTLYDGDGTTRYKPTGLLHDYGTDNDMLFGLLTGSFNKNLSGGVLRNAIGNFSEEFDPDTGIFDSSVVGIVATINKLQIHGFDYSDKSYPTNCGWIANRAITEGECASWGNPIGEMLYEAMRYFSGAGAASSTYSYGDSSLGYDESLDLPTPDWDDPYDTRGTCANPNILLISDINPSYDSDQLPGAYSSFAATYSGSTLQDDDGDDFSLTTLLSIISSTEGKNSGEYFIGQSGADTDNAPTEKEITGLGTIRGLAPAEPTKQGSYSSSAVAYFGLNNDIHSSKSEDQNVTTMVVSLASNLPEIEVEVEGQTIKIIPFAKTVYGTYSGGTSGAEGDFQPTNTIVDWYVEEISTTKGVFRINFEDVEQGADHDMDMIATYTYEVKSDLCTTYSSSGACTASDTGLEITIDSTYAAGSFVQHAGYIISGTTNDGMYLEVRDKATSDNADYAYYLDTPSSTDYSSRKDSGSTDLLPYEATRNFFPSTSDAAEFLPSPLWYAAKWGGFDDSNNNGKPDLTSEWDSDSDGDPDNYFPVTNAGELKNQLTAAFDLAYDGTLSGTATVFSSSFLVSGTLVYQTSFEESTWSGDIDAYIADDDGNYSTDTTWSAADELDAMTVANRKIFTRHQYTVTDEDPTTDLQSTVFEFTAPTSLTGSESSFSDAQLSSLLGDKSGTDAEKLAYLEAVTDYIRGDQTHEADSTSYEFRERDSRLGDIINSTPYYVASGNGHDVAEDILVFGANDGMVHIVEADTGEELAAYIPSGVYDALGSYVGNSYVHEYSVDGGINAYSEASDSDPDDITTTLVGRLGLGVKGLYAIDVSDMRYPRANMMKWEITTASTGFEGIGYNITVPAIAELANEKASVIFSNGYNSIDDDGAIYIADLSDGSLIKKLSVGTQSDPSGDDRPNALAQPALIDNDGDGVIDHIYAGDLFGNMWVFDISSEDTDDWGINTDNDEPLFTAYSSTLDENSAYMPQPITTRPSIVRHPVLTDGVLVGFGTGKYIESTDSTVDSEATQSFYVIADPLTGDVIDADRETNNNNEFTNLVSQSIIEENDSNRLLSTNEVDWSNASGFYLDLINTEEDENGDANTENYGERQVVNSYAYSNQLIFVTAIPNDDACVAGGSGWYVSLNLYTGQVWDAGTAVVDDPTTDVDESLEIPTDSSIESIDGIATGISAYATVTTETTTNADGSTTTTISVDPTVGVSVTEGEDLTFELSTKNTGPLSWRNLY